MIVTNLCYHGCSFWDFFYTGLFVFIMLCLTFDASSFTALMRIGIRQYNAFIQTNFSIQPSIAMRWILGVIGLEKLDILKKCFGFWRWVPKQLLPMVEAASINIHHFT